MSIFKIRLVSILALVSLSLASLSKSTTRADEVLHRVPENVLGFFVVRDLSKTSDKVEHLLESLDATYPAPLAFATIVTGLEEGLNLSGNLVVALLPGEGRHAAHAPLVLLPVTDYQAFARSINADTSGEICRVTLMGEDILVARDGAYAMLMNVEHQTSMEELIAYEAEPIAALNPLSDWLPKQNVALVLTPAGMEALHDSQQRAVRLRTRRGMDFTYQPSYLTEMIAAVSGPQTWASLMHHTDLVAVGMEVDPQSNVRLSKQVLLKKSSQLSQIAPSNSLQADAQLGLSQVPCVLTGGGPVAEGWGAQLARFMREAEQAQAAQNGMQHFSPVQWDKEEQAFLQLFSEIRSCSFVMLPGEKGEPLVGNFLGVAKVPSVETYFESLPEVVKSWNELTQQSTSDIKPEFVLTKSELGGKQTREMVVDIASAARDANTPAFNWMLESALGMEGKLRVHFLQVDETRFIFGLATTRQLQELLKAIQQDRTESPHSAAMLETLELMESAPPWKMLIRPQGCLRWAVRVANEFLGTINDTEVTLADMPNSPPLGITLQWQNRHLDSELVCPAETWSTLGKYLSTLEEH